MIISNYTQVTSPEQQATVSIKNTYSKTENVKKYNKGDYIDVKQYTHKNAVHIS